ncbi:hypothetical protein CVT24_008396 [Panaeolus cyanescens]|uniref:Uncharacterized protein n=1 Tax=Panaeolus cyanescens TaxID=181874 RepID=A0A409VL45_9AGAR|nr:hypothetical protein CVT24_008396 [Panaeolus cyanescens]
MKFALAFFLVPLAVVAAGIKARNDDLPVFTVEEVFPTIIDTPPFMIEVTTTRVWTQSPSVTPATTIDAPLPTLDPAYDVLA